MAPMVFFPSPRTSSGVHRSEHTFIAGHHARSQFIA